MIVIGRMDVQLPNLHGCLSRVTFLLDDVCVQDNKKMPDGLLYKAARKGDVEVSIAVRHTNALILILTHTHKHAFALTHSLTLSRTHSLTHSLLAHSLTHSLTYSIT